LFSIGHGMQIRSLLWKYFLSQYLSEAVYFFIF
jgi:hypothetical protein